MYLLLGKLTRALCFLQERNQGRWKGPLAGGGQGGGLSDG